MVKVGVAESNRGGGRVAESETNYGVREELTCLALLGLSEPLPLRVDGHHGDGVGRVRQQVPQNHVGGPARHLLLQVTWSGNVSHMVQGCQSHDPVSPPSGLYHVLGPALRGVEEAVVSHVALRRLPAHLQGAGGGVGDLQVLHAAQGLWGGGGCQGSGCLFTNTVLFYFHII